jgi:hypothetical protein
LNTIEDGFAFRGGELLTVNVTLTMVWPEPPTIVMEPAYVPGERADPLTPTVRVTGVECETVSQFPFELALAARLTPAVGLATWMV